MIGPVGLAHINPLVGRCGGHDFLDGGCKARGICAKTYTFGDNFPPGSLTVRPEQLPSQNERIVF